MGLEGTSEGLQRMDERFGVNVPVKSPESGRLPQYASGSPSEFEASTGMEIRAWIESPAELRRVFSALSNSEYIECWMGIAEEDESAHWVLLGSEGVLCISMARSGGRLRVYKLKIQSKPNNLVFFWGSIEPNAEYESRVDIVLRRRPHRCILELRHSGIRNLDEVALYSGIWRRSLGKLKTLMK